MPYPSAHNLLVVQGENTAAGLVDVFQFGIRFQPPAGGSGTSNPALLTAANNDIKADLSTWWNSVRTHFASTTRLLRFKFNAVDTEGRYVSQVDSNTVELELATPGGSSSAFALPPSSACVVTFRTPAARGLASKGRIYLPNPSISAIAAGGIWSEAFRDAIQTATATLLTNLSNWPGTDALADFGTASVMSKVREGASRPVTSLDVGIRPDVQRRRSNRLSEQRQATTAVT